MPARICHWQVIYEYVTDSSQPFAYCTGDFVPMNVMIFFHSSSLAPTLPVVSEAFHFLIIMENFKHMKAEGIV